MKMKINIILTSVDVGIFIFVNRSGLLFAQVIYHLGILEFSGTEDVKDRRNITAFF